MYNKETNKGKELMNTGLIIEILKVVSLILGILWSIKASKGNPVAFILACFALYFMFPDCVQVIQNLLSMGNSPLLNGFKEVVRYFAIGGAFVGSFLVLRHSTK